MSKTLTEMAAEILAARVKHESMTSKEIENCLNDTFEALQKLKEKEDVIQENAAKTPAQPAQTKVELKETTVEEPIEKPEQALLKPEPEKAAIQESIEKPEESLLEPEEASKPAVQTKKGTIASTILNLIKSKPKGVDTKYIMEQTGFKKSQVWATINSAKKKGQIKTKKRGIYVSVKSREVK
jgi:predicted transcriptional regulator